MRIEGYIATLLYNHSCVIVPGFGAFLAHSKSAAVDTSTNRLNPPLKTISFNSQLTKSDGILISHMAQERNWDYDSLLKELENLVNGWKKRLENGETLELLNIGKFWLNTDQKIQFQPENRTNYLTSSFGMAPLNAIPIQREVMKEEVEELENNIPFIITPEKRDEGSFRPWLKYAAILLLTVSLGFTGFKAHSDFQNKQEMVQKDAQKEVTRLIQEATFFSGTPLELPAVNITLNKKKTVVGKHHVIGGAFRLKENAQKRVSQLKKKGYDAFYLGTNAFGLHQVAYSSFEDPKKALVFLKKIRKTESPDAWLLSEK